MQRVLFPYGKKHITYDFGDELVGVLESSINEYTPKASPEELVLKAIENPVNSPKLCDLARDKKKIVIIASDHTRPVPSKVIMPAMLKEIRRYNREADITILIATGCHRGTTVQELEAKFGKEIVQNEKIYIHDCDERDMLQNIGTLPSGGQCEINRLAYEADLLVAEGFIEPHLFAGFSGGRKSVLPGIAGRTTVLANHCSEFIAHERARTGILEGNPIHEDMLWASKTAGLKFIVNVVLDADKKVIFATAGEVESAHKKGTDFLKELCGARAVECDIAITTNGGYPLDQNIYQSIKGMTAAEATVKNGGVIIMLSESCDGVGGEHLYHQLADEPDIDKTLALFLSRGRTGTEPDQWMSHILLRILKHATVIYVSNADAKTVTDMHMIPAHSLDEAIIKAKEILNLTNPKIVAIPDGIAVMVTR